MERKYPNLTLMHRVIMPGIIGIVLGVATNEGAWCCALPAIAISMLGLRSRNSSPVVIDDDYGRYIRQRNQIDLSFAISYIAVVTSHLL